MKKMYKVTVNDHMWYVEAVDEQEIRLHLKEMHYPSDQIWIEQLHVSRIADTPMKIRS